MFLFKIQRSPRIIPTLVPLSHRPINLHLILRHLQCIHTQRGSRGHVMKKLKVSNGNQGSTQHRFEHFKRSSCAASVSPFWAAKRRSTLRRSVRSSKPPTVLSAPSADISHPVAPRKPRRPSPIPLMPFPLWRLTCP